MKQNKENILLIIIILAGILIRLATLLISPMHIFQYDIGLKELDSNCTYHDFFTLNRKYIKENGNMEYLIHIYNTGHMLESNTNQGYHPPLHHYITAGVMRIFYLFGASEKVILESAEIPAFIYSMIIMMVVYKIAKELELRDKSILIIMALVSFNPLLIFLSKTINNDALVTMFTSITLLYLIKWYKKPTLKNVIILALALGLGACSKISILVMFMPAILVYFKKMVEEVDDIKMIKRLILHAICLVIISTPLIFWYPIRNAIKFNQPLFGIAEASSDFSVRYTDFINRWLINSEIFTNILELDASNVWSYVINSSLIFVFDVEYISVWFLNILKLILITIIIFSIISAFKSIKESYLYVILFITQIMWILSFIIFNYSLPYSCTMHSRYIVINFIISMIFIGKLFESTNKKWFKNLIITLVALYSIGTMAIFGNIFYIL